MTVFIQTLIAIFIVLSYGPAYAASSDTPSGQTRTIDQKKELAGELGIVLPGMTKAEVRKTFGLIEPEIWYTPDGQEAWQIGTVGGQLNIRSEWRV